MTWTYSGDPSIHPRDQVRFLLGDTVETTAIFSDEEIDWLLTESSNPYLAAANAADVAASQFSSASGSNNIKTKTVGALSITYSDLEKAKEYRSLSRTLRLRAALNRTIMAYSGGISVSDKEANEQDSDWSRPFFSRGMHDNPGADHPELLSST